MVDLLSYDNAKYSKTHKTADGTTEAIYAPLRGMSKNHMDVSPLYLTKDSDLSDYNQVIDREVEGVWKNSLLNNENGSTHFAMRTYQIEPNGHTSRDTHEHDHGVYVLKGMPTAVVEGKSILLTAGDVLHIAGNEEHQFFNEGDNPAKFICVKNC